MEDESIFVCEFELGKASGFLPQPLWDWLRKKTPSHLL
jgi:hypothetical protein